MYNISTHLWQVDVGNDDLVQGAWGVPSLLAGVSTWVVLVCGVLAGLPWLGILNFSYWVLGRRRGWVAREVPSGETKSTGHDCEKDLHIELSAIESCSDTAALIPQRYGYDYSNVASVIHT